MSGFKHLTINDSKLFIEQHSPLIVDIRDAQSFALGHIAAAFPLTNENISDFLARHLTSPDGEAARPLVVVCYHGISSQNAANYLHQQGFSDVYSLDGGFTAWQERYPEQVVQS